MWVKKNDFFLCRFSTLFVKSDPMMQNVKSKEISLSFCPLPQTKL